MATKTEVAEFIGVSERQLSNIIRDNPGAPIAHGKGQWDVKAMVRWYITVLKANAKTSKPADQEPDDEEIDPKKKFEKRKQELELARLEADVKAKQIKNNKDLQKWAPIDLLEYAISKLAGDLSSRLDGLIPRLKLSCPELTPEMMAKLENEKANMQNECANATIDFTEYDPEGDEFSD